MSAFLIQMKWQLTLLRRNNIVSISFAVTLIYGLLLYLLRNIGGLDKLLVSVVLNDPSIIGYFFIALAIYTEIKHQVLPAIFVTPVNLHHFLITRTLTISMIGVICSLGLAMSVKGFGFDFLSYTTGSFGICILSALLGLYMLTFTSDFLKFAMLSVPVFLAFINLPLIQYLGVVDLGVLKYLFPVQGSVDLIDHAISGTQISYWYSYVSILLMIPLFYRFAFLRFQKEIVHQ